MKKLFALLLTLMLAFSVIACAETTTEEVTEAPTTEAPTTVVTEHDKNYWATGAFAGWGDAAGNEDYLMEAIDSSDPRVEDLALDGVELLYIAPAALSDEAAGWDMKYIVDGTNTVLDGNLAVKVIRTAKSDDTNIPEWWAQSPESGEIANLTPDTLFIPEFVENATTSVEDGGNTYTSGAWNDNPAALAAGNYYMVFAQFENGDRAMGLVEAELKASTEKSFYATGAFAGWGDAAGDPTYLMEAVVEFDPRISCLDLDYADVELVYVAEASLSAEDAEWEMKYIVDGANLILNGNLAVKVIRTSTADTLNIPEWWAQSPESGEIMNLTPETLFIPEFVENANNSVTFGDVTFTSGAWNDNPAALVAGDYYFVYVEYVNGDRAIGLVPMPAPAE